MKKLKYLIGILIFIIGLLVIFYNTSFYELLIRNYIFYNLPFLKNFQVKKFTYNLNTFYLDMQKDKNIISLYGKLFPFSVFYDADFNNLSQISNYKGSLISKGMIKKNKDIDINGNAIFADGYSLFNLKYKNYFFGKLNGKNFNTQKLFFMLNINFPYLIGKNDLNLKINAKKIKGFSSFKGKFISDIIDVKKLILKNHFTINDNELELNSKIFSNYLNGELNLTKNKLITLKSNIDVNLTVLNKLLHFPFESRLKLNVLYSSESNVWKFFSKYLQGFFFKNLNITINNMPSKEFFKFLGKKEFFKALLNGDLVFDKQGKFEILVKNIKLLNNNKIINLIESKIGQKIRLKVAFIKGKIVNNKIYYTILAKGNNLIIKINKGFFDKFNSIIVFSIKLKNKIYWFEIKNSFVKLLKIDTIDNNKESQQILVL